MAFDIVMHVDILLMKKGKYLIAEEIFYSNPERLFLFFHSTGMLIMWKDLKVWNCVLRYCDWT